MKTKTDIEKAPGGTAGGEARETASGARSLYDSTSFEGEMQAPRYDLDWTTEIERLEMQSRIVTLQLEQAKLFAALETLDGSGV